MRESLPSEYVSIKWRCRCRLAACTAIILMLSMQYDAMRSFGGMSMSSSSVPHVATKGNTRPTLSRSWRSTPLVNGRPSSDTPLSDSISTYETV